MAEKPHKGRIENWATFPTEGKGLGYRIIGVFDGHPEFHGRDGGTSYVVTRDDDEIETRNSRYTLGKPAAA